MANYLFILACVFSHSMAQSGSEPKITYNIMEELPPDTYVGNIRENAKLDDKYDTAVVESFHYGILQGRYKDYFTMDEEEGVLRTSSVLLDRESLCAFKETCTLTLDVGVIRPTQYFQVITIAIYLQDKNDNPPKFPKEKIQLNISENVNPGATFVIPTAVDLDAGVNGVKSYEFISNSSKFDLKVTTNADDTRDLRLLLKQKLDREAVSAYDLLVIAKDGGSPIKSGSIEIRVNVVDSNDNSPIFTKKVYNTTIPEDYPVRTPIVQVYATDKDTGANGRVVYGLSTQTVAQYGQTFAINRTSGHLYLNNQLDYEQEAVYTLLVEARDEGPDSMPEHAKVIVNLLDVNDHQPMITVNALTDSGLAQISEWADIGTFVAHVSVEDVDRGPSGVVDCRLDDGHFDLQPIADYSGQYKILTADTFDYEQRQSYRILLVCEDGGEPALKTSKDITVSILDMNDHSPVFSQDLYAVSLRENNSLDSVIMQVGATDMDDGENGRISYHVHDSAKDQVKIDEDTGAITSVKPFDHEKMSSFQFKVLAVDNGSPPQTASSTVNINIIDINDESPRFLQETYTFGTFENQLIDTEIGTVSATDPDSPPYNEFTMYLHPDRTDLETFEIDPRSGVIRTKKVLDREHQATHFLTVVAANTAYPRLSSTVTVTVYVADVNDNAPSILFPSLHNDTAIVSAHAPKGYIFSRVDAKDADFGTNAKLVYQIAKGNDEGLLSMDPITGALSVDKNLLESQTDEVNLVILVKDQGQPQKSAVASIDVIIDHDHAFTNSGQLGGWRLGFHQKIIIILGCVTAVLVIVLVTAIIILKYRQAVHDKETQYKYTCRVDLARGLCNSDEASDAGESIASDGSVGKPPKKSVSFDDSGDGLKDHDLYMAKVHNSANNKNHLTLEERYEMKDLQRVRCLYRDTTPTSHNSSFTVDQRQDNHNNTKDTEACQLFDLIKDHNPGAAGDTDSASAASNADSGRGTSEAGDHGRSPDPDTSLDIPPRAPIPAAPGGPRMAAPPVKGRKNNPLSPSGGGAPPRPPRSASSSSTGCHGNGLPATRTNSFGKPCKVHNPPSKYSSRRLPEYYSSLSGSGQRTVLPPPGNVRHNYILDESADNISDGGSTTSGSYVVDLDHSALKSVDV